MKWGKVTQLAVFSHNELHTLKDEINEFLMDCNENENEVIDVKLFAEENTFTAYVVFKDDYIVREEGDA